MAYTIRMGVPEMEALWNELQTKWRSGTIRKDEEKLYKKWGSALKKLSENPMYPGLKSHEIDVLSKRYGMKVWQSYLIGLEPHPEDKKKGAYDRIKLSELK